MQRLRFTFIVAGLLALVFVVTGLTLGPGLDERLIPGVWIWNVPVGGLQPDEALSVVQTGLDVETPRITLTGPDKQRWIFSPADLGVTVVLSHTLSNAYAPGHKLPGVQALFERLAVLGRGRIVAPVLSWERAKAELALQALASQLDVAPKDARVALDGTELRLESGASGYSVDVTATLEALEPLLRQSTPVELPLVGMYLEPEISDDEAGQALDLASTVLETPLQLLLADPEEGDPGPWALSPAVLAQMLSIRVDDGKVWVGLDEAGLGAFLEPMQLALRRKPENARFHFDEDPGELTPLSRSQAGRELDLEATIEHINAQLQVGQHFVPLVVETIEPDYPETMTAEMLGIREVVAVGESYFTGSSSARDHNIKIGASKFNGIVIGPGETFSFNAFLGDVTPAEGYDESYVIVGNQTVLGVGGGICQVATTAFRAAFFGGYEIIERWPHAYRVAYYEIGGYGPGFDATIYSPLVDFRFVNDAATPLLIETEVDAEEARLRFIFYGTGDGREVEQIGPKWGDPEPAGPPVYEYDAEMEAGTVELLERSHEGLTATLERVVTDAQGEVLHRDRFVSHFVPWSARYRYGPGVVPPAGAVITGEE